MFKELPISDYLQQAGARPLVDVRAPREFAMGHIPGAVNIPLFDDAERAVVGITYKKEGRQAAIRTGLAITGPKLESFLAAVEPLAQGHKLAVHCWRGGMRSQSMATLFDFAGFDTQVIKGGYKAYRKAVHAAFTCALPIIVLGGRTGSGKTKILQALAAHGEQILDLEQLAHHKGSAFGDLGEAPQPTTEMFENVLFDTLRHFDLQKRIWVEDESHMIGTVFIPEDFWQQMRMAPVVFCDVPAEERIRYLVQEYGQYDAEGLIQSVHKITKRLGGQHAKAAIEFFEQGNLTEATRIVLAYYDKAYAYGISQRPGTHIHEVHLPHIEPEQNAEALIRFCNAQGIQPASFHTQVNQS